MREVVRTCRFKLGIHTKLEPRLFCSGDDDDNCFQLLELMKEIYEDEIEVRVASVFDVRIVTS